MSDSHKVVVQDIPFNNGNVFAYRVGDKITAEAVQQNGWDDYVTGPNTKEAKQALGLSDADQEKGK